MTSAPSNPVDVPPFQIQHLISGVVGKSPWGRRAHFVIRNNSASSGGGQFEILCAQAYGACLLRETASHHLDIDFAPGSEIYVGCSTGELIRFALQADDPNKVLLFFPIHAFRIILKFY